MNIFNLITHNLGRAPRTKRPDDSVPFPLKFRGQLKHAAGLCTGCGTCAYACSSSAIKIEESGETAVLWNYSEDRCTFCGFCVAYCPTQALSFAEASPAPITERAQHYLKDTITLPLCQDCGKPFRAIPEATLIRLYGEPLPPEVAAAHKLCERCRQRATGQRFMSAVVEK